MASSSALDLINYIQAIYFDVAMGFYLLQRALLPNARYMYI